MTSAPASAATIRESAGCGYANGGDSNRVEPNGALPIVLFVDDEEGVLAGLRSSLRRLRRTYRFLFALGVAEALDIMAVEPVAVVVTDMRMPGRNGVDLLDEVRAAHPEVIRYVLSGEAEAELVIRSVPVAHRWLTKPCNHDALTEALDEAVRHRVLVADPAIRAALAEVGALPSPPTLYAELLGLLADGDVPMQRVADLVGSDAAVTAKLLQWANSAFSGGRPVTDVRTAVTRIGLSAVSQLVLSVEVVRTFGPDERVPGFDAELLHDHVAAVSGIASRLVEPEGVIAAGIGGLLSHVGLLLQAEHLEEKLATAYDLAVASGASLVEAQRETDGITHAELGGHLLSIWGLPSNIVLLAAGAHELPEVAELPAVGRFDPVQAVRTARLLAQRLPHAERIGAPHIDRLDQGLDGVLARLAADLGDLKEMER